MVSAAPARNELEAAEHRLYGVRDGAEPCSAAEWAAMAGEEIARAHGAGKLPVLVGGTGLYLRTLLEGIAPVPPIDPAVRTAIRSATVDDNRARLARLDPETAGRLGRRDSSRIARALEVVVSTGRSLASWQGEREGGLGERVALRPLVLLPPRDWLYERCDRRFSVMMAQGAVEEVEALLARGLDAALPVMRAIGVREIAAFVRGECSREQAIAAGRQATRRYAKRQYTWFAHQPPAAWPRFTAPLDVPAALALLDARA